MNAYARGNRGQDWETAINRQHRVYSETGHAWTWHTYPPFLIHRRTGKGGEFHGRLMGEAPPDYLVFARGWLLMAEAKTIRSLRLPWSAVKDHQARQLSQMDTIERGASILLVRCVPEGEAVAVMWTDVSDAWSQWRAYRAAARAPRGSASMAWPDLCDRAVWHGRCGADYLGAVLEELGA